MRELLWRYLARLLTAGRYKRVANWVVNRAKRTPYLHLDGYMNRWWRSEEHTSELQSH